eukprot:6197044-Pleurochrysis_carterae.AAC.1
MRSWQIHRRYSFADLLNVFSVSRGFSLPPIPPTAGTLPPITRLITDTRELKQTNKLERRTASLLRGARDSGAKYVLNHPADRGAFHSPLYLHKRHAPLWLFSDVTEPLRFTDSCSLAVTAPQYALGPAPKNKNAY